MRTEDTRVDATLLFVLYTYSLKFSIIWFIVYFTIPYNSQQNNSMMVDFIPRKWNKPEILFLLGVSLVVRPSLIYTIGGLPTNKHANKNFSSKNSEVLFIAVFGCISYSYQSLIRASLTFTRVTGGPRLTLTTNNKYGSLEEMRHLLLTALHFVGFTASKKYLRRQRACILAVL